MAENDPPNPPAPPPAPPAPTAFTPEQQQQINDLIGRNRNEGKQSGQKELLEALGLTSLDDAKAKLKALADIEEKNKDEITKAADRATKAEADLNTTKSAHDKATLDNRVATAVLTKLLGDEGAKVLDKAKVIRRLIEVEGSVEDKDITTAVEELSKTMPELFSAPGNEGGGPPPKTVPGKPPPPPGRPAPGSSKEGGDPHALALTRLHERHPRTRPAS